MNNQQSSFFTSGIRDNRQRGTVAEFLKANIESGSSLAIVSAYFTIYAFAKLEEELNKINQLNFLFGEPSFIQNISNLTEKQSFKIENADAPNCEVSSQCKAHQADEIKLQNKLQQKATRP